MKRFATALALALLATACSGEPPPDRPDAQILVAVNAALGTAAGRQIERGAQLAVDRVNERGGVRAADRSHRLALTTLDTKGDAATAADNIRAAIGRGAVAIVGDGAGVEAVEAETARLGIPLAVVTDAGGAIDPAARPNVFRVAPSPGDLAVRIREYLVPKNLTIAVVHDDGPYGRSGLDAMGAAFGEFRDRIAGSVVLAEGSDGREEIAAARRAGAGALLIWAPPAETATVLAAARRGGWDGAVFSGPAAADPAVRESAADEPRVIEGAIVAMGRLNGGPDAGAYDEFRREYESRFGADALAVRQGGQPVVDPPRWAMYASDAVEMLAAALARSGSAAPGSRLIDALEETSIAGANGARRRFDAADHDAVDRDEIFFARFNDFVWVPVKDDPRSAGLPDVGQIG